MEELLEDTALQIIDKIYSLASDIRGDWSDPRHECREIWRLCDKLKDILKEPRPLSAEVDKLLTLIDSVIPIVELWKAESLTQIKWQKDWIENAKSALMKAGE